MRVITDCYVRPVQRRTLHRAGWACALIAGTAISALGAACRAPDARSIDVGPDREAPRVAPEVAADGPSRFGRAARTGVSARILSGAPRALAALGTPSPIPASTQFDITGFLEDARTAGPRAAGSLTVNGHVVTVPANTVVILPASALTWDELFTQAPLPYGPAQTGLAMSDVPAPLTTSEVHVIGNRVTTAPGGDQYIAGLIYLAQQSVNAGAGFINFIDYAAGEIRIGGGLGDPSTGARVRINDPAIAELRTGRYSKGLSPDPRFTVDQDNPTILSATGFPMCLPRVAPPAANAAETDPLCPQGNRPLDGAGRFVINLTMPDPASLAAGQLPDPRIQAPLEVGDFVDFAGILVADRSDPTSGPWPGTANTYIAAYSIVDNTAIFTAAGTDPAYVEIEVTLMGTGGLTAAGVGEAAARTRFEGMSTDPSRLVHLYAIDLDPATGAGTDRDLGTIGVDSVAVPGRWRFRPPCDPFGTVEAAPDKTCVSNQAGTFLPPTREVRAVIEGQQDQIPETPGAQTTANGLVFGQYHAPILEYVFPENVPGTPMVPNNFEAMPFLACGGFRSSGGTLAGPLDPWPGAVAPVCANAPHAAVANAGAAQTAASGALVTLAGSATGTAPLSFAWTQTAGPAVALSDPASAAPSFTAPAVNAPTALGFALTVSNAVGSSTATTTVTVNAAAAPTVGHIPPRTVGSGTPVTLTATCTDPNRLACNFAWTQTAGAPVVLSPNPRLGATITFTVALPAGGAPATLQFSVVATNTAGQSSAPEVTAVTVTPPADTVAITNAEYRTGKQRLILTATSSVVSPTIDLTLAPYVTSTGAVFDPAGTGNTFTNAGGGNYTLTVVGVPEPAIPSATPLTARSSAGGVSPPHGIDRLRQ
jgi:hypothetical protein